MKNNGIIACLIFAEFLFLTTAADPCQDYAWLNDSKYRGTGCPSIAGRDLCDKYITPRWYRVEGDAKLVTEKVELFNCATSHPIWMPEQLPKNILEMNATVCVNKGDDQGGCEEELRIKIKHCSSYYVYYLQPPDACPTSYCFGQNKTCPPFEPCDKYYHDVLRTFDEKTFCEGQKSGWYMMPRQTEIKTKCHPTTGKTLWINSSNANPGEVFDAQVCFQNGDSCCDSYADVQVKNCSGSLIFNISKGTSCFSSDSSFMTSWNNGSRSASTTCYLNLLWVSFFIHGLLKMWNYYFI